VRRVKDHIRGTGLSDKEPPSIVIQRGRGEELMDRDPSETHPQKKGGGESIEG